MSKILLQYNRFGPIVTGGHVYEDNLYHWLKEDGIDITRRSANVGNSFLHKLIYPFFHLRMLKEIKDYDTIIFNSSAAVYFLPLLWTLRLTTKKQVIIIHHHFLNREFTGIKRFFYKAMEHLFLKSANVILTPSPYILSICRKLYTRQESVCLPIPFTPVNNIDTTPRKGSLVYMGTIEPRKGLIYLIKALRILKGKGNNYTLTIVGKTVDELYKNNLDILIDEAGLEVRYTGFIDESEKNRLLSEADVFVFPSLLEGYGMVICEAMAHGLPVVCFDNSAMPFTVQNGKNGILVPDRDHLKFANAIKCIVEDRKLREKLSQGAREYTVSLTTPEKFRLNAKELFLNLARNNV